MGTCESLFNLDRDKSKNNKQNDNKNNKGSNLYCAPIDSSENNDNIYVNSNSMSQMTMDMSHYHDSQKPAIYQYINQYKTNGLQKSVVKASLVEIGGNGNSLMYSNFKNSKANQTINSIYTSKCDDTGYESSYDGYEMIVDGKMDEELVKKSSDKNTINNYNIYIKKNEDDNNNANNKKVLDYYKKTSSNTNNKNNVDKVVEENKDGDELSRIPSTNINQQNKNFNDKNIENNRIKYIQQMGKY